MVGAARINLSEYLQKMHKYLVLSVKDNINSHTYSIIDLIVNDMSFFLGDCQAFVHI